MDKSPPELIERFSAARPADADVTVRKMFGYPGCFIGGNLFTGLSGDGVFVRLGEPERSELMAQPGCALLEPLPGRPMKEHVVVSQTVLGDVEELAR